MLVAGRSYSKVLAGFCRIKVEVDNSDTIRFLTKAERNRSYCPLVYRIKMLVARDWEVRCSQIHREVNAVVDMLANYGLRDNLGDETFVQPLDLVLRALSMDVTVFMS
ncbi:hypothetical protein V6N13_119448 [Hibiscus sabdariffa]